MLCIGVEAGETVLKLAGKRDKEKSPPAEGGGLEVFKQFQNGGSFGACSGAVLWAGASVSAWLNRRTEFVRTLQIANSAALVFFDFPFSRSYFELTGCPSTRTC